MKRPTGRPTGLAEPLLAKSEQTQGGGSNYGYGLLEALSRPTFGWVRPLLSRTSLTISDLMLMEDGTDVRWADAALRREIERRPERGLAKALVSAYWRPMFAAAVFKLAADLLRFVPPLLLAALLRQLKDRVVDGDGSDGGGGGEGGADAAAARAAFEAAESSQDSLRLYMLAVALPVSTLLQALVVNQYFWRTLRLGVLARSALSLAIYRRAVSLRASDAPSPGSIANLLGTDAGRINSLAASINMLWSSPLQVY